MKKIRFLSFVVVLALIFSTSAPSAYAADLNLNDYVLENSYSPSTIKLYSSAFDYYEGHYSDVGVSKDNCKIALGTNKNQILLRLSSSAMTGGKDILFKGNIYSVHGNGYYDDKLILGDFEQQENLNIVQFKILREYDPILTLLIEDVSTGKLLEFTVQTSNHLFSAFMQIASNNTTLLEKNIDDNVEIPPRLAVSQRVLSLMQPAKRMSKTANLILSQSHSSFKSTSSYSGSYASVAELTNFCTSINNSSSGGITPSSAMRTILNQTGWKMYKSSTYFYVLHGVANSSTEQLVGITVASISNNKPSSTKISASYTIIGSCTVSYNKTSQTATLLQYDTGIRLEDATVAIELVNGTTNFYEATKTWNLSSSGSGAVKDILIAISDNLGIASAIWNALKSSNDSSQTVDFGSDTNQEYVYLGLVRAVANQTSSGKYLWGSGNSLGISGLHYNNSSKTYSSHRIAWGFTAYSLL